LTNETIRDINTDLVGQLHSDLDRFFCAWSIVGISSIKPRLLLFVILNLMNAKNVIII